MVFIERVGSMQTTYKGELAVYNRQIALFQIAHDRLIFLYLRDI